MYIPYKKPPQNFLRRRTRLHAMPYDDDGLSGRDLMTSLGEGKDRSFNIITGNWVMNPTSIVDNWYVIATQPWR